MDRDLVHRQTAAVTVKQPRVGGCAGLGCEDAITHLLNYTWAERFRDESRISSTPFLRRSDGLRAVCLGPGFVLGYTLQGLFSPGEERVREDVLEDL